jgi:hypothetical protein
MADFHTFRSEILAIRPRSFLPIFPLHPCSGVCGGRRISLTSLSDMRQMRRKLREKRENFAESRKSEKIHALAKLPRSSPEAAPKTTLNQSLMKPLQVRMIIADAHPLPYRFYSQLF